MNKFQIALVGIAFSLAKTGAVTANVQVKNEMNFDIYVANTYTKNSQDDSDNAAKGWTIVPKMSQASLPVQGDRQDFYARDETNYWRWTGTDFIDCMSARSQNFDVSWDQDENANALGCPSGTFPMQTTALVDGDVWVLNEGNAAYDHQRQEVEEEKRIAEEKEKLERYNNEIQKLENELSHCDFEVMSQYESSDLNEIDSETLREMALCSAEVADIGNEVEEAKDKVAERVSLENEYLEKILVQSVTGLQGLNGMNPEDPAAISDYNMAVVIPPEVYSLNQGGSFYSFISQQKYIPEFFVPHVNLGNFVGFLMTSYHWSKTFQVFANDWETEKPEITAQLDWLKSISLVRNYFSEEDAAFSKDENGFREDLPIPQKFKDEIVATLMSKYPLTGQKLRDALNSWQTNDVPSELIAQRILCVEMGYAMVKFFQQLGEITAEAKALAEKRALELADQYITNVKNLARVGVSFTPAGDLIDFCETVTGKEHCLPSGRKLDKSERILAGIGIFIGSRLLWKKVGDGLEGATEIFKSANIAEIKAIAQYIDTHFVDLRNFVASQEVLGKYMKRFNERFGHFDRQLHSLGIAKAKQAAPYLNDIPDEELYAMYLYTDQDFTWINSILRNAEDFTDKRLNEASAEIVTLASGLGKMPRYQGKVTRITEMGRHIESYQPGNVVIEKGFFSNSILDQAANPSEPVKFITTSKNGRNIEEISKFDQLNNGGDSLISPEREVLFAPGSKFLVKDRYIDGDNFTIIHLEEID